MMWTVLTVSSGITWINADVTAIVQLAIITLSNISPFFISFYYKELYVFLNVNKKWDANIMWPFILSASCYNFVQANYRDVPIFSL